MNAVSLDFERALPSGSTVMGIDEAGRGPLAGPVFAAAVSVPLDAAADLLTGPWAAINDSKKLSERRRDALAEVIKATPSCTWAVASASALEIDQLNILRATHLAMRRATTILPRKARRDPMYVPVYDESSFALAYDPPPSEYAWLYDR